MAQGKLSPRQKMINLMYLVFIAMLALNMSKEVLSAFGLMEKKFADSNEVAVEMNSKLLANLETKGDEKPAEFAVSAQKAQQISQISEQFYRYVETLKTDLLTIGNYEVDSETGLLPFEDMDKTNFIDEAWFTGDKLTVKGQEFIDKITAYKGDIKGIVGDDVKYLKAIENFEKRFDITDVKDSEGITKPWLDYHFKGFPSIASYTKLTAMQNDVKVTEANMFNVFLGNTLDEAVSLKNYTALVIPDKNAFFAGERFQGKVVLGKYANVTPTKMIIQNEEVDLSNAIDSLGAARLDFTVGGVGEHEFDGEFTFMEDGKELPIPITGNYVVVPRPNSATISADKMNVVYRGVNNPMTISFAGVADNKVSASASGLSKGSGIGKYNMNVTTVKGREVTINVTATLDDGTKVNDRKTFRIKDIPRPTGTIRGEAGATKMQRNSLEISSIGAMLEDFDFDLQLRVSGFKFKVPGQPTITVSGNKLNSRAKAALRKAKRGSSVQIFDINAKLANNASYILKKVSPVFVELTN